MVQRARRGRQAQAGAGKPEQEARDFQVRLACSSCKWVVNVGAEFNGL